MNKSECNGTTVRHAETSPGKTACIYFCSIVLVVAVISSLSLLRFIISICHYEYTTGRTVCSPQNVVLEKLPIEIPSRTLFLRIGGSEYVDSIEVFNASKHEHHEEWEKGSTIEHSLAFLDGSNFSRFKNLRELTLFRCGVEEIGEFSFANLAKLKKLSLRNNRLKWMQENSLAGLSNLTSLDLSNNPLLILGNFLFSGSNMITLTMEGMMSLSSIDNDAFNNSTLEILIIGGASMSILSRKSLEPLKHSLKALIFVDNSKKLSVDEKTFENFEFLNLLNLTNNSLSQVSFLKHADVNSIILDHNLFENGTFQFFDEREYELKTEYLSISKANLSKVPEEISKLYKLLQTFILTGNNIVSINAEDFCDMNELHYLDLSYNKISIINKNIIEQLPQLTHLELHSNLITDLPQELETFFDRLQAVTISDNPLQCNCNFKWFSDWLKTLNVSEEILEDLDKANCSIPENVNILKAGNNIFLCHEPVVEDHFFTEPLEGDMVILECAISGDPPPTVTWEQITSDHEINPILVDEAIPKLISSETRRIININTTHIVTHSPSSGLYLAHSTLSIFKSGNFTCIGENSMGIISHQFDTYSLPITKKQFKMEDSKKFKLLSSFEGVVVTLALLLVIAFLIKRES